MPRIDARLLPVVTDIERGLRELGVPFGIVGALVPELLLDARPARMTNDADVVVIAQSLAEFEGIIDRLAGYGFTRTRVPHRLRHATGGLLDILPYDEALAPSGKLQFEDGVTFNMAGFRYVVPHAVMTSVEDGPVLPLAPLPLYALLKLVAFSDRKAGKDLGSLLHCLEHYLEDDDRRYGVEFEGQGVPWEYTCAYLLGADGCTYLDAGTAAAVGPVLQSLADPDADVVGLAAAERGRLFVDDDNRVHVFELFRWYRLAAGL
jgi:predicted nucleotidyltransferase